MTSGAGLARGTITRGTLLVTPCIFVDMPTPPIPAVRHAHPEFVLGMIAPHHRPAPAANDRQVVTW